jgi:hypothetical protein
MFRFAIAFMIDLFAAFTQPQIYRSWDVGIFLKQADLPSMFSGPINFGALGQEIVGQIFTKNNTKILLEYQTNTDTRPAFQDL